MSKKDVSFGFGNKPRMKEVPPGTEATFSFNGDPEIVETEWGDKYSFPITLITHDSHPLLADGPMDMTWESKCGAAKQLYMALVDPKQEVEKLDWLDTLKKSYKNDVWQLTRFDNGAYFLDIA